MKESSNGKRKKPCPECPYALGLIHTVTNPCPQCKLNDYQSYEWFRKQWQEKASEDNREV